jgi:hypothetical protein
MSSRGQSYGQHVLGVAWQSVKKHSTESSVKCDASEPRAMALTNVMQEALAAAAGVHCYYLKGVELYMLFSRDIIIVENCPLNKTT